MKKNNMPLVIYITLTLILASGCNQNCEISERDFSSFLSSQMIMQKADSEMGLFKDSGCVDATSQILERLTGHRRNVKFVHFKDSYMSYLDLQNDSLIYDSLLAKMTNKELHEKILSNCEFITNSMKSSCLIFLEEGNHQCFISILNDTCMKNK